MFELPESMFRGITGLNPKQDFWTFHTFVCYFFSREPPSCELLREKIQSNVWKVQNTTGCFLAQLHRSNFVLKTFC